MSKLGSFLIFWFTMINGHLLWSKAADTVSINRQLEQIAKLESKETNPGQLARAYTDLASELAAEHRYQQAKDYLRKSLGLLNGLEDKRLQARNHVSLSNIMMEEDDRTEALLELTEALEIYKDLRDSMNYLLALKDIGINYDYLSDHESARVYYEDCITLAKALNQPAIEGACLKNIGGMYSQDGDQATAIEYYEKAVVKAELSQDSSLLHRLHHGLGLAYMRVPDFEKSHPHCLRALQIGQDMNDTKTIAFGYQVFGFYYLEKRQLDSAEYYMDKTYTLATQINNAQLIDNAQEVLQEVYYKTGRYKEAYDTYKAMTISADSMYTLENSKLVAAIQSKYQTERRERELAEKNLQLQEASYSLITRRRWQVALFIIVFFLIVIIVLIYRSSSIRQRTNKMLRTKNLEIEQHVHQVESLNEHKNRWFINVAHELRTPLTLIKGPVQRILKTEKLSTDVHADLMLVERNTANLSNLVNEILDLSKMEEGEVSLKETIFSFNELVAIIVNTFESRAIQQGITLRLQELKKIHLLADREKLHKVVFNLVSNALKFTSGSGSVEVILGQMQSGDVSLTVKDNGIGIDDADLPFIFNRFYQSSSAKQEVKGGTGIGLALSKEITEMHGGTLKVTSTPGMGSTFKLTLPADLIRVKPADDVSQVLSDDPAEATYSISSDGRLTFDKKPALLLVEDNDDMRTYVGSLVQEHFDVIEASNGRQALELLSENRVQFIISDVMMPEMDGISFLKQVKANDSWRQLPFVHLSALSDETLKKEALRVGIDDYLVKPFDPEELVIRVNNLYSNYLNRLTPDSGDQASMSYDEKKMKRLKEEVLSNLDDNNFNVLRLADAAAMSERQLYRYLKSATGLTPLQFIQEIKLSQAHEFASKKVFGSTGELASAVGFKQAAYFSSLFEKRFGKKPGAILKA